MAITKFVPEVWSATLLSILEKALVYAGAPVVNRNYEGEIAAYGDTVHITSIADPSIVNYTKDTDLTVEVLTDAEQLLTIDRAGWKEEMAHIGEYLEGFGDRTPAALEAERARIAAQLA